jgi:Na+-driven multidrug efflux pump
MGKILRAFFEKRGNLVTTIILVILGICMVIALPFLFVFGLRLLGLGVEYSMGSWFGSLIVLSLLSAGSGKKGE